MNFLKFKMNSLTIDSRLIPRHIAVSHLIVDQLIVVANLFVTPEHFPRYFDVGIWRVYKRLDK